MLNREQIQSEIKKFRILIVEDDPDTRRVLSLNFQHNGFKFVDTASNGQDAIQAIRDARRERDPFRLILLDLMLPGISGFDVCEQITLSFQIPVIVVTAKNSKSDQVRCFELGAEDFIEKPFDNDLLRLKVGRLLAEKYLISQLEQSNYRNKKLFLNILQVIAKILEAKDSYTQFHSENVAKYARRIARKIGFAKEQVDVVGVAGILHDIGKIGIQDAIINKVGKLTDEEFEMIKKHPTIAAAVLEPIEEFQPIIEDIRHHHERFDGRGYPAGLKGARIPLGARIIAVSDAFDVMTTGRQYMTARSHEDALEELRRCAGAQFDPDIVEMMGQVIEEELGMQIKKSPEGESGAGDPPNSEDTEKPIITSRKSIGETD